MLEEFEDTKWIIRICKSKKYTQHSFFTGCFLVLWRFFTWVLIDNVLFLLVPIYFAVLLHHLCNKTGKNTLEVGSIETWQQFSTKCSVVSTCIL